MGESRLAARSPFTASSDSGAHRLGSHRERSWRGPQGPGLRGGWQLAVCDEGSLAGLSLACALGSRQQGEMELACYCQAILDSSVCSPTTTCLSFPPGG